MITCVAFAILLSFPSTVLAAPVRNIILCIGDGMGPEHVKAARYYAGTNLFFESFPYQADLETTSANAAITDSAAAATAMATGLKVNNGVISLRLPGDGGELETLLEYFKQRGKSTGLVATSTITHATPAAFGAHETSRTNTEAIANDYLTQTRPNVLFGGGGQGMTAAAALSAGYTVVRDTNGLFALDLDTETFVSGQFGNGYMPYEYDGLGELPHLHEMTEVALKLLGNDPDGFFLMVEGSRIDHAGHANDLARNIQETLEFARTVECISDWMGIRTDTLLLVTADHETGGLVVTTNNGAGNLPDATWSTTGHTATPVALYARGLNAHLATNVVDNTQIYDLAIAPTLIPERAVSAQAGNWLPLVTATASSPRLMITDTNMDNAFQGYRLISVEAFNPES
jgi:alkaline phosphatase